MTKCGGCKKYIARADIAKCAKCTKCGTVYHPFCLKGGEEGTPNWVCPGCASGNQPPAPIVDAPVAEGMDSLELPEPVVSDGRHNSTANDTTEEFKVELGLEIRLFREELSAVREEIRLFRAEVKDLKSSFSATEERLSTLDSRVDVLEKRVMEGTGSRLESVIAELRLELNEKDQELLGNDVEVSNLPEENGENATHMIMAVATKLGVTLRESDIVSAERVGARRRVPGEGGGRGRGGGGPAAAAGGALHAARRQGRAHGRGPRAPRGHLGRPQPVLSAAPLLRQREVDQVQPPIVLPNAGGRATSVLEVSLDQEGTHIRPPGTGHTSTLDTVS
ncbi:hypothetical protein JYU34_004363 [Plutella xylostella]|uniref:PHD-type domain-containing protein n=1 Tax=Plutella xylostella TaxID=51655 RepID=A0ABQ7QXT6_PLUXY|nr:hypothetical protein JYU34_004363 [Plutella xylostella]